MIKPETHTEDRVVAKKEAKEKFHSSFKAWIRVVAFIVAAVFLPEQVAQAVEYDWRVLWHNPAVGAIAPSYLKDLGNIDTALAIRNVLKDIANKPITAIKISSNLTINLDNPLKMSNQRIEEIYEWLKGKPCGTKSLYDYLNYSGKQVAEGDIAILALTIDILNDVVKPEGNPGVIKTSLYALSKASEFFGQKLYPVKLDANSRTHELTNNLVPFIAHLNGDHYVLVTRVTEDKIYFSDDHREEFLPKEKFLNTFSGYALVQGLSLKGTVPVTDSEAKKVLGAKSDSSNSWTPTAPQKQMQDYSSSVMQSLDNEISSMRSAAENRFTRDIAISVGTAVALAGISSYGGQWFGNGAYAGMNSYTRYAITGAATGIVVNKMQTGDW
ncbi:MAG: hypothetical protein COX41_05775, partial [Candidatus Omnitrophica bacterium CG23_combo_of_CG06-09_8_20_14_all_41_10]